MAKTLGVKIEYGDYIVGAKEDFTTTSDDVESFCNLDVLKGDEVLKQYKNPCEWFSAILDGSGIPFPESPEDENMPIVSDSLSEPWYGYQDPIFEQPIVLEMVATQKFTAPGISFTFDTYNKVYPTVMNIKWFRDDGSSLETLADVTFNPDGTTYFCEQYVEDFNRVKIEVSQLNVNCARLKIYSINFGKGHEFKRTDLLSASVSRSIDPMCTDLTVDTGEFALYSRAMFDSIHFQVGQRVKMYFDDELLGALLISEVERDSNYGYSIQLESYIGQLEKYMFDGGMYFDKSAKELIAEILEPTRTPFNISSDFDDVTVSGHIPYTTAREALQLVLFAIQGVVSTAYSELVNITKLSDDDTATEIPNERLMEYPQITENQKATSATVTAHDYHEFTKADETDEIEEATREWFSVSSNGRGEKAIENGVIEFDKPCYNIRKQRDEGKGATIKSVTCDRVVYSLPKGTWDNIYGYQYVHNTEDLTYGLTELPDGTAENKKTVNNCELVDQEKAAELAEKLYNYYNRPYKISAKIAERKRESGDSIEKDDVVRLGDVIALSGEYGENVSGRIISENIDLKGGILVRDVEVM